MTVTLRMNDNRVGVCLHAGYDRCSFLEVEKTQSGKRIRLDTIALFCFLLDHDHFPHEAEPMLKDLSLATFPPVDLNVPDVYELDPDFFQKFSSRIFKSIRCFAHSIR